MTVRDSDEFDAVLGGETYPTRALASHGFLVISPRERGGRQGCAAPLEEQLHRCVQSVESLIMLSDGTVLTGTNASEGATLRRGGARTSHFLPYRRAP